MHRSLGGKPPKMQNDDDRELPSHTSNRLENGCRFVKMCWKLSATSCGTSIQFQCLAWPSKSSASSTAITQLLSLCLSSGLAWIPFSKKEQGGSCLLGLVALAGKYIQCAVTTMVRAQKLFTILFSRGHLAQTQALLNSM